MQHFVPISTPPCSNSLESRSQTLTNFPFPATTDARAGCGVIKQQAVDCGEAGPWFTLVFSVESNCAHVRGNCHAAVDCRLRVYRLARARAAGGAGRQR